LISHGHDAGGNGGPCDHHIHGGRPLVEGIQQGSLLDVAQSNGEPDFVQNLLIDDAIATLATAGLPNRINSRRTTRVISLREASGHIGAEPGESAANRKLAK
jgi:hypothetical protein